MQKEKIDKALKAIVYMVAQGEDCQVLATDFVNAFAWGRKSGEDCLLTKVCDRVDAKYRGLF